MARRGAVHDYQDFIEKGLPAGQKAAPNAGDTLDRYLTYREQEAKRAGRVIKRYEAFEILETVVKHFKLDPKVCEVDDLTVDSEPYGDATIGAWVRFRGDDVYDDTLMWTYDDGFHLGSWGDEYEAWEEEQYSRDPYPKIQHDGPQGSEDIVTPDYINFYTAHNLWQPDLGTPIFTLPFTVDEHEHLFPAPYREEGNLKDPEERQWWLAFFTALIEAEHRHRKTPSAYWVSRYLDYFWTLRSTTRYGGQPGHEVDNFHYSKEGRAKVEALLKWQNRRAARAARRVVPTPPPPAVASASGPQHGDLYTDAWDARLASGITFYEIGRTGRPVLPLFTITRNEIARGQGWPKLAAAVQQQSIRFKRAVTVWAAPPNAQMAHWRIVNVPRRTPGLSGYATMRHGRPALRRLRGR